MATVDLSMLPNIWYITLNNTAVTNLSFNGAAIKGLSLQDNNLASFDTSGLSGNANLTGLNLSHNNLAAIDLTPLQTCSNLALLRLDHNQLGAVNWSPMTANTNITEINLPMKPRPCSLIIDCRFQDGTTADGVSESCRKSSAHC